MLFNIYTCKEALSRLDDYVDRELSEHEMHLVERHLKICRACTKKYAFETSLLRDIKQMIQRVSAPPDMLPGLLASLTHPPQE